MELIVAVDKSWGMAKDNTIPWKFSTDMKYFMNVTKTTSDINKQNVVIMGRKTWDSLPEKYRPLTERINIVISTTLTNEHTNYHVVNNFENAVKLSLDYYFTNKVEKIFVIGGAGVYEEALHSVLLQKVHVTLINKNYECDLQFPKQLLLQKCWNDMSLQKDVVEKEVDLSFMIFQPKREFKGEDQYLNLLWNTYNNGDRRQTRNHMCISTFGGSLEFDLNDGFPMITTKKLFLRGIFEELRFFLMGDTNSNHLSDKGVNIWKPNSTREFLDSCGLVNYMVGELGPIYGYNWRFFNAPYEGSDADYTGKGIDQFANIIDELKKNKYSRRILMTTLNPATVKECVLWPCHGIVVQFHCGAGGKLNCCMFQRSIDSVVGFSYNMASYAMLVHIVCNIVNNSDDYTGEKYTPGVLKMYLGDVHIYDEPTHINALKDHLSRKPYPFPKFEFKNIIKSIDDLKWEDVNIINYKSHPAIKVNMVA